MSTNLKLEKNILSSDIKAAGKNTKEKVIFFMSMSFKY